jgi:hypothetical protein
MSAAGEFILPKHQPREKPIQRVTAYLSILAPDKDWLVTIGLKKRSRSDAQNRYLHGVQALLGSTFRVTRERGTFVRSNLTPHVMAIVHPPRCCGSRTTRHARMRSGHSCASCARSRSS